jgi:hypothetical protein
MNAWGIRVFLGGMCLFVLLNTGGIVFAQTGGDTGSAKIYTPPVVYVADFQLEAEAENKASQRPFQVRKRVKDKVDMVTGAESPGEKAKEIINSLAQSIVAELNDKNVVSKRLYKQPPPASRCWVLEGEFVEHDEGDRLKRAVIGFGSGSSDMQVAITLSEVAEGSRRVLLDTPMDGKKDRMPGAVITKNPYVAGAKFVLTKNAPDRDVKKLGSQIADRIYGLMKEEGLVKQ